MTWLALLLACAASAQAPGVPTLPAPEVAGVPVGTGFNYLLGALVVSGAAAAAGTAVIKFWREVRGPDVKQDEELRLLRAQVNVLRALVLGKASKVEGAVGPGLAGILLGSDHGGTGDGLVGAVAALQSEAGGRADNLQKTLDDIKVVIDRLDPGGPDAAP